MKGTTDERIKAAIERREDLDIFFNLEDELWTARVPVDYGQDGINHEYIEAESAVGILKALIRILETP